MMAQKVCKTIINQHWPSAFRMAGMSQTLHICDRSTAIRFVWFSGSSSCATKQMTRLSSLILVLLRPTCSGIQMVQSWRLLEILVLVVAPEETYRWCSSIRRWASCYGRSKCASPKAVLFPFSDPGFCILGAWFRHPCTVLGRRFSPGSSCCGFIHLLRQH